MYMKLILICNCVLLFSGCSFKHFAKTGKEPFCLVNYEKKTVDCSYPNMDECVNQLDKHPMQLCVPAKKIRC